MLAQMPDRHEQDRLEDLREAERTEATTEPGTADNRRAAKATRRGRWAYEDAVQLVAEDEGAAPASLLDRNKQAMDRAAALGAESVAFHEPREAAADRADRERHEAEIKRELGD